MMCVHLLVCFAALHAEGVRCPPPNSGPDKVTPCGRRAETDGVLSPGICDLTKTPSHYAMLSALQPFHLPAYDRFSYMTKGDQADDEAERSA
ncbi:hypothetical protein E6O75_ATG00705 [Venturia nashicola]|uniref:Uncharacterized protein n=1 Tax=Venturia nashicola TaxID=86259 RepID=A0A4Z1PUF1_9PEZI|nr:hypothetical protein E6O75_ATG00705 [Venturia nashicola]